MEQHKVHPSGYILEDLKYLVSTLIISVRFQVFGTLLCEKYWEIRPPKNKIKVSRIPRVDDILEYTIFGPKRDGTKYVALVDTRADDL